MIKLTGFNPKASRRGFTLIEVVTMVLVMAIAVPPTLEILMSNSASRANVINTSRATMLASNVLEGVIADVTSTDALLGFEALADASVYLNTPTTGFYSRMSIASMSYEDLGMSYTVTIGELVGSDGLVSLDTDENVFRIITVNVAYPSADGAAYELPVSVMVSTL
jgi:type II secretory pathway pseudopilin PulG